LQQSHRDVSIDYAGMFHSLQPHGTLIPIGKMVSVVSNKVMIEQAKALCRARISRSRKWWRVVLAIVVMDIIACSGSSYFADSEDALKTAGYFHVLDHITAYYPGAVSLNFPGYVVGLEEAPTELVSVSSENILVDKKVASNGYTVERLLKSLRYYAPFVSQVMRYEGQPYGDGNCSLYSLYHNKGRAFVDSCSEDSRNKAPPDYDYRHTYSKSWDAIDILKERLLADVASGEYTHLVIAVMGLDTVQEEAVRNYKSIISTIRRDAGEDFKPLFVGITWPSFFANRWFDPFWEALAYSPIADRADILGLSWLGALLNDAIMPLTDKIEVNVIAHSFGARATSMALCVGPAILRNGQKQVVLDHPGQIENFIGLAPAFSLQRFVNEEPLFYENVYYSDYCPRIKRFIFTASDQDHAFDPAFWSDAVGDHEYMVNYCNSEHVVPVNCIAATEEGEPEGYDPAVRITYVDTSRLMLYQMPGTKGGGHADIFRPAAGRLMWSLIDGATQR
jgi:hypothetical protein